MNWYSSSDILDRLADTWHRIYPGGEVSMCWPGSCDEGQLRFRFTRAGASFECVVKCFDLEHGDGDALLLFVARTASEAIDQRLFGGAAIPNYRGYP
jgi:hypothetical protein